MIAIINYDAGNLASVSNALKRLDVEHIITNKKTALDRARGVIFPGVGHARPAMESLQANKLDSWLRETRKPVLGICLGMQLFYEVSEEGSAKGLGIIPGKLKKFDSSKEKVPHMGWNNFTEIHQDHPIIRGFGTGDYFYYVHSYYAPVNEFTIASCRYITEFTSVVCRDNFTGVQFHPEKSGEAGSRLIQNFIERIPISATS